MRLACNNARSVLGLFFDMVFPTPKGEGGMTAIAKPAFDFFALSKTYGFVMSEEVRRRRGLLVEFLSYPTYGFKDELSDSLVAEINRRLSTNVSKQCFYNDMRAFRLSACYLQGRKDAPDFTLAQVGLDSDAWLMRPLKWLIEDGFSTWVKIEQALGGTPTPPPAEEFGYFLPDATWEEVVERQGEELRERAQRLGQSFDHMKEGIEALVSEIGDLNWDLKNWRAQVAQRAMRVRVHRSSAPAISKPSAPARPAEPTPPPSVRMRMEIPDTCAFFSTKFELSKEVEKFDFPGLDVTDLTLVSRMLESLSSGGPTHPKLLSRRVDLGVRTRSGEHRAELWITEFGIVRTLWKLNGNCCIQRVWKKGQPDLADYDAAFERVTPAAVS